MTARPYADASAPTAPQELVAWLDAGAEITRGVNRGLPLEDLLNLIAGATCNLTGYDFCAIMVEDVTRSKLVIRGSYGLSQDYIAAINARRPISIRPNSTSAAPSGRAFRSQRPVALFDIHTDDASKSWDAEATEQGYCSLLSVPLLVADRAFGVINCYTQSTHEFSAPEVIRMESMANQAALAIESTGILAAHTARSRELDERNQELTGELVALRRADDVHARLMQVVIGGGGLRDIASALARTLHATVVIDDANGQRLAIAAANGESVDGPAPQTASLRCRPLTSTEIPVEPGGRPVGRVHDVPAGAVGTVGAVGAVDTATGTENPGLMAEVLIDADIVGQVWALAPVHAFGPIDRRLIARGALVVALAMLKDRTAQEVEWRLSRAFLDDFLDAEGQSSTALTARAKQLGADLSVPHSVLVIRRDRQSAPDGSASVDRDSYAQRSLLAIVQRAAKARDIGNLTASRSDHIVVVLRDDDPERPALAFAETLRREINAYTDGSATVSVSSPCADVLQYADAYHLASSALDLVQEWGGSDRVISLDAIGAYRLLLQVKRPRELLEFAHSVLDRLHAYDRRRGTELAHTLDVYMRQRCRVGTTATQLHVHGNTVTYRLHRIEELLDIDLSDPEALVHIKLAFMIESVLGDGRPSAAPASAQRKSDVTAPDRAHPRTSSTADPPSSGLL